MYLTVAAQWLNDTFAGFDYEILAFLHSLHTGFFGPFFDGFFAFVTALGNGGLFLIGFSVLLMFFRKTRKTGLAMLISVLIGVLLTNVAVKNLVERMRPYAEEASVYYQWWLDVGHGAEHEIFSFPSGHATSAFAVCTVVFLLYDKRKSWPVFLFGIAMGLSRNYIMVHYPSDILGGALCGIAAGLFAVWLVKQIYEKSSGKFGSFLKNSDVLSLSRHRKT